MLLIDNTISIDEIKRLLQCPNNNCSYMAKIADAKSTHHYGFSYDCNKVASLCFRLNNTNHTTTIFASKFLMSLQYIIIISIVLIAICILIICIKKASKSNINNVPLIDNQ